MLAAQAWQVVTTCGGAMFPRGGTGLVCSGVLFWVGADGWEVLEEWLSNVAKGTPHRTHAHSGRRERARKRARKRNNRASWMPRDVAACDNWDLDGIAERPRSPGKRVVYGIPFCAMAATLRTIAADREHLGAEIGFVSVLHTWSRDLRHHRRFRFPT